MKLGPSCPMFVRSAVLEGKPLPVDHPVHVYICPFAMPQAVLALETEGFGGERAFPLRGVVALEVRYGGRSYAGDGMGGLLTADAAAAGGFLQPPWELLVEWSSGTALLYGDRGVGPFRYDCSRLGSRLRAAQRTDGPFFGESELGELDWAAVDDDRLFGRQLTPAEDSVRADLATIAAQRGRPERERSSAARLIRVLGGLTRQDVATGTFDIRRYCEVVFGDGTDIVDRLEFAAFLLDDRFNPHFSTADRAEVTERLRTTVRRLYDRLIEDIRLPDGATNAQVRIYRLLTTNSLNGIPVGPRIANALRQAFRVLWVSAPEGAGITTPGQNERLLAAIRLTLERNPETKAKGRHRLRKISELLAKAELNGIYGQGTKEGDCISDMRFRVGQLLEHDANW